MPALSVTVPQTSLVGRGGGDDATARPGCSPPPPTRAGGARRRPPAPLAARRRRADGRQPGRRAARRPDEPARQRGRRSGRGRGAATRWRCCPGRPRPSPALRSPARTTSSAAVGCGVAVTSSATEAVLFASVWDLGPDDPRTHRPTSTVLPGRAVAPVRVTGLTPGRATTVEVALPVVSHTVPVGHRLRLVLGQHRQRVRRTGRARDVPGLAGRPGAGPARPRRADRQRRQPAGRPGAAWSSASRPSCSRRSSGWSCCGARRRSAVDRARTSPTCRWSSRAWSRRTPTDSGPSTASRSGPSAVRSSGCSDPTAPARRRRCGWSSA